MIVDVFQDTVCPWCRIGKQHLYQAMEAWHGEPIEIQWRGFLLDPSTPLEGRSMADLANKLGGEERLAAAHAHICKLGEACGVDFNFGKADFIPNTVRSHQLIFITPVERQTDMVEAVTKAYFEDGKDIGQLDVLLDVAESMGLNRAETRARLEHDEGKEQLDRDVALAHRIGATGVPLFIINQKIMVSGAQPVDVFLQAFEQAV